MPQRRGPGCINDSKWQKTAVANRGFENDDMNTPLRIGAVTYLNSKPLVEHLPELFPDAVIRDDYPSRLADDLANGKLDVALIPSIEYFRGDDYEIAFTLPPSLAPELPRMADAAGIPMTVIGRIVGPDDAKVGAVTVRDGAGRPVPVPVGGYRHR